MSVPGLMYKQMGRNITRYDILKFYGSLIENMADKFDKLDCGIVFTKDIWIPNQNESYKTIKTHL